MNDTVDRLKVLREELETALAAVLDNNPGLKVTVGRATYDRQGSFTFKLTGTFPGGASRDQQDYEMMAHFNKDLPPFGTVLEANGQRIRIVGGRPRANYNITVDILTGGRAGKRVCYKAADIARMKRVEEGK
jgi:hypothetical protein